MVALLKDEWSGFADLLANLIAKYAAVLDMDDLPEPPHERFRENFGSEKLEKAVEKRISV